MHPGKAVPNFADSRRYLGIQAVFFGQLVLDGRRGKRPTVKLNMMVRRRTVALDGGDQRKLASQLKTKDMYRFAHFPGCRTSNLRAPALSTGGIRGFTVTREVSKTANIGKFKSHLEASWKPS